MRVCVCLRVKGEDALVVAADQEDRGEVLGQSLQPGHVKSTGHGSLPGQGHAPVGGPEEKGRGS